MIQVYGASAMWKQIGDTQINDETIADLSDFRSNGVNARLALVDVGTNGGRFLKTLIYNLAGELSQANWVALTKIHHREFGDPVSVTYNGVLVDLDYLRAVYELEFIERSVELSGAVVLEIGAGYGRTCHTLISNHDLAEYWIVDLPNTLELSRKYLSAVLTAAQFAKVRFVQVGDIDGALTGQRYDLVINIDSMAEMNSETVRSYLRLIREQAQYFYVNNPVGKFLDKSLDGHSRGEEAVAIALKTGLLTDVIDIHDNRAVEKQSQKFVDAYRPGEKWNCVADGWARPWSYYWHALYQRPAER